MANLKSKVVINQLVQSRHLVQLNIILKLKKIIKYYIRQLFCSQCNLPPHFCLGGWSKCGTFTRFSLLVCSRSWGICSSSCPYVILSACLMGQTWVYLWDIACLIAPGGKAFTFFRKVIVNAPHFPGITTYQGSSWEDVCGNFQGYCSHGYICRTEGPPHLVLMF